MQAKKKTKRRLKRIREKAKNSQIDDDDIGTENMGDDSAVEPASSIDPILVDWLESHAVIKCGTRVRSIALSPSIGKRSHHT